MKHFWDMFWKFFGIALLAILAVAVITGIITRSADMAYLIVRLTFIIALGICGAIGLLVPAILYFEEKKYKEEKYVAE
ncbi:MAG: hypothetical protein LBK61_14170 [Spirochaetaceae bacterium]|jgi:hypothetical protein|nr:hypothetical protein [Spirochaetaceae bacterium]